MRGVFTTLGMVAQGSINLFFIFVNTSLELMPLVFPHCSRGSATVLHLFDYKQQVFRLHVLSRLGQHLLHDSRQR
jgi:hypothetical protein